MNETENLLATPDQPVPAHSWETTPPTAELPTRPGQPELPEAVPASGGPPPDGAGPAPDGLEQQPARSSGKGRAVLATAIVAALLGAGAGAGAEISHLLHTAAGSGVTSSTAIDSNGLDTGSANATAVTAAAKKVLPSVVTITIAPSAATAAKQGLLADQGDTGTGIILSSTGEILTNNHVIAPAANGGYTITVTFDGGAYAPATIVDRDPTSDLAVIQATNVSGLTPATLGDSTSVQVGQPVLAIGAPLGMSDTVTSGIVSALNRPVLPATDTASATGSGGSTSTTSLDAIQTDAAINPGNSGGPLIDLRGDVIGIDAAIASTGPGYGATSQSGSIGLGFAIPITQAEPVIQELEAKQAPTHAVLGISVADASTISSHAGAILQKVAPHSAAANAGLQKGDEIIKIGDQEIDGADALQATVHSYRPGTSVTITYIHNGETRTATATLGSATGSTSRAAGAS